MLKIKKSLKFLLGMVLLVSTFSFFRLLSNPNCPTGYTNAPALNSTTARNCTSCHGDYLLNAIGGGITVTGLPSTYTPGASYPFSIKITHASSDRKVWGFSIKAIDTTTHAVVGTWTTSNANTSIKNTAGSTSYELSHANAATTSAGANTYTYSNLTWTAPTTPTTIQEKIKFYVSAVAGNSSNDETGDYVYTTAVSSTKATTVTPCTFTYGTWSTCTSGTQTRTYTSSPTGCSGTPPTDSITRTCTVTTVPAPTVSVTQPTCTTSTGTITVTSSTVGLTFSTNGIVYTNTTGIFTGLLPGTYSVTAKNSTGVVSSPTVVIINTKPSAPGLLTIAGNTNINQCDTLQTYSVPSTAGVSLYSWTVTGTGNYIRLGQGSRSVQAVMKVAGTVYCSPSNECGAGTTSSLVVAKSIPTTPVTVTYNSTNICPFMFSTGLRDTFRVRQVTGAVGYIWEGPAGSVVSVVNDTTAAISFADTTVIDSLNLRYVKVYAKSQCDTSLAKSTLLTRALPTSITIVQKEFSPVSIAAVQSVCGLKSETYKIRKVVTASSYNWALKLGTNASIVHLNGLGANDTAVTVNFLTGFIKDTLTVQTENGCGVSLTTKSVPLTTLAIPPTPTAITPNTGNLTPCIGNTVLYTVTSPTPLYNQQAPLKFLWTKPLGTTITLASPDSSQITLRFDATFVGGSLAAKPVTACGVFGTAKTITFTPSTPIGIVNSKGVYNACIGDILTFAVIPPTTPTVAISGYRWTRPLNTSVVSSVPDSSVIDIQFNAGYVGGILSVKASTICDILSAASTKLLTHTGCAVGTRMSTSNLDEVLLYPNPNDGNFTLNIKTNNKTKLNVDIQIIDMFGKSLGRYTAVNNNGEITKTISNKTLPNGTYVIKYTVGNTTNSVIMSVQK